MLLTSAPVAARHIAMPALPLDLHVLSLSLAFILSQDQTLRCVLSSSLFFFFIDDAHSDFRSRSSINASLVRGTTPDSPHGGGGAPLSLLTCH